MKKIILLAGLVLLSLTAKASDYYEQLNYCSWMGKAAYAVAKNRDLGIDEYSLIGKYLAQGNDYDEQVIVISLIDRAYGTQLHKNADNIELETKSECLGEIFSYLSDNT